MKMFVTPQPKFVLRFFTKVGRVIADSLADRSNGSDNRATPWILYVR